MLFACTVNKAQIRNLSLGFAPLGYNHVNISLDDEEYKYDYKSYWNANLGYERQFKGMVTLFELGYSKATFDEYELKGNSEWFEPARTTAPLLRYWRRLHPRRSNAQPDFRFRLESSFEILYH